MIATPGPLPTAMRIEEAIDRDKQFDRGFLEPLKKVLDSIGWRWERTATLEDFFG